MARRFAGLMLMRIIGETHSAVKKIQQKQGREIVHLDKPILRKQSILKTPFQNPTSLERRAPDRCAFHLAGWKPGFGLNGAEKPSPARISIRFLIRAHPCQSAVRFCHSLSAIFGNFGTPGNFL
jgi:hypothetical protein